MAIKTVCVCVCFTCTACWQLTHNINLTGESCSSAFLCTYDLICFVVKYDNRHTLHSYYQLISHTTFTSSSSSRQSSSSSLTYCNSPVSRVRLDLQRSWKLVHTQPARWCRTDLTEGWTVLTLNTRLQCRTKHNEMHSDRSDMSQSSVRCMSQFSSCLWNPLNLLSLSSSSSSVMTTD